MIDATGELTINEAHPFPVVATTSSSTLRRTSFHALLRDVGNDGETAATVLDALAETFDFTDLKAAIAKLETQSDTRLNVSEIARLLHLIAASFYRAVFEDSIDLSRRVLWPTAPNEASGMEDARFVRFEDGDEVVYYATYTAFDGLSVSQQLLETTDFVTFVSSPLAGRAAQNKGLALFPRKVNGQYVALSRHDRESNAVTFSTDVHEWESTVTAHRPRLPWEILQLGNCGSPIELDEGWLVIYHGVGPMRTYGIGALLLDRDDPSKVIAQLPRPLLIPADDEQDGYVPNVVYSCGSIVHRGTLYMPYGIADQSIGFATYNIAELLAAFESVIAWSD
ncbi:MAG: glycoside hydrolase family 130 protein [Acidimicrobiales bacterium]